MVFWCRDMRCGILVVRGAMWYCDARRFMWSFGGTYGRDVVFGRRACDVIILVVETVIWSFSGGGTMWSFSWESCDVVFFVDGERYSIFMVYI